MSSTSVTLLKNFDPTKATKVNSKPMKGKGGYQKFCSNDRSKVQFSGTAVFDAVYDAEKQRDDKKGSLTLEVSPNVLKKFEAVDVAVGAKGVELGGTEHKTIVNEEGTTVKIKHAFQDLGKSFLKTRVLKKEENGTYVEGALEDVKRGCPLTIVFVPTGIWLKGDEFGCELLTESILIKGEPAEAPAPEFAEFLEDDDEEDDEAVETRKKRPAEDSAADVETAEKKPKA